MKIKHFVAASTLFACALSAHAQSAGSLILSAGWDYFIPRSHHPFTSHIENGVSLPTDGMGMKVNKPSAVGLAGTYFITDNLAGEIIFNTPARLSFKSAYDLEGAGQIASADQWSPALLLKYYFGSDTQKFRPFLGAGVGYTWFSKIRPGSGLIPIGYSGRFSVSNQWTFLVNGGFSYQFNEHWLANLSVSYMTLRPTAKLHVTSNDPANTDFGTLSGKLKLNPVMTFLNVGYRF